MLVSICEVGSNHRTALIFFSVKRGDIIIVTLKGQRARLRGQGHKVKLTSVYRSWLVHSRTKDRQFQVSVNATHIPVPVPNLPRNIQTHCLIDT